MNVNNANKKIIQAFVIGALTGGLFFLCIYGIKVLNVTYDAWLMREIDLSQHYLGWTFYRNSQWAFPVGLTEGIVYPERISIMYLDSIPIFAIIFKILSPLLPHTFQYFGLWGLLCFILQGGIAAVIVRKYSDNRIVIASGAGLLVLSSTVLQRMFGHTALAGQWIILLAICVWIYDIVSIKKRVLIWCGILVLSIFVHMYFMPMILAIAFFNLFKEFLSNRNWKCFCLAVCSFIISILGGMYFLGAFYGGGYNNIQPGLGYYSANYNCLFNSSGMSAYLKELPVAVEGQRSEGFAYMGLGGIFIFIFGVFSCIINKIKGYLNDKIIAVRLDYNEISIILAGIVLALFAASPKGCLNDKILYDLNLSEKLIGLFSIFRSSGRFAWPIMYACIIWGVFSVLRKKGKWCGILIVVAFMLQLLDFLPLIQTKKEYFGQGIEYASTLQSKAWEYLSSKDEIICLTTKAVDDDINTALITEYFSHQHFFDIAYYAKEHGMMMNDFYVGRRDIEKIDQYKNESMEDLKKGNGKGNAIYIFSYLPVELVQDDTVKIYEIDGLYVGTLEEIPLQYLDEMSKMVDITDWNSVISESSSFVLNGVHEEKGIDLKKDGILYGPYFDLPFGEYEVEILGENFNQAYFDALSEGNLIMSYAAEFRDENCIRLNMNLSEDLSKVELRVVNTGDTDIKVRDILLKKVS